MCVIITHRQDIHQSQSLKVLIFSNQYRVNFLLHFNYNLNIIIEFFKSNPGAQKLILEHNITPPISSSDLHKVADTILRHVEGSIGLPNMFNKSGVFLVVSQIIFSILSLNTKENGELTDVGLNEALRATNAYLLSCIVVPT